MSPDAKNESAMDVCESFSTFAVQGDAPSAERELNGMRDRPLLKDLSFPPDDEVQQEKDCQNLSGRILEANVREPEFYGLLTCGRLSGKTSINNVVGHHGYDRKNTEALRAIERHQNDVEEIVEHLRQDLKKAAGTAPSE